MEKNELKELHRNYIFSKLVQDAIEVIIDDLKKLQQKSGKKDSYNQGVYNGLEVAKSTLLNTTPEFLNKNYVIDAGLVTEEYFLKKEE